MIGTASAGKHEFVRGLGADEVIDYTAVDFADAVKEVDVVLDTIGGDTGVRSVAILRDGGILVCIKPRGQDELLAAAANRGVRAELLLVEADHAGMTAIAGLVEAGTLVPAIAETFPLAEAAKAHELGQTGRTAGKLVLIVDSGAGTGPQVDA